MPLWVVIQMVQVLIGVILFALFFGLTIWFVLDYRNYKRGEKLTMMMDILQNLYDARYRQDTEEMEKCFQALTHYGMNRETALDILEAGKKFFGKEYFWEENLP